MPLNVPVFLPHADESKHLVAATSTTTSSNPGEDSSPSARPRSQIQRSGLPTGGFSALSSSSPSNARSSSRERIPTVQTRIEAGNPPRRTNIRSWEPIRGTNRIAPSFSARHDDEDPNYINFVDNAHASLDSSNLGHSAGGTAAAQARARDWTSNANDANANDDDDDFTFDQRILTFDQRIRATPRYREWESRRRSSLRRSSSSDRRDGGPSELIGIGRNMSTSSRVGMGTRANRSSGSTLSEEPGRHESNEDTALSNTRSHAVSSTTSRMLPHWSNFPELRRSASHSPRSRQDQSGSAAWNDGSTGPALAPALDQQHDSHDHTLRLLAEARATLDQISDFLETVQDIGTAEPGQQSDRSDTSHPRPFRTSESNRSHSDPVNGPATWTNIAIDAYLRGPSSTLSRGLIVFQRRLDLLAHEFEALGAERSALLIQEARTESRLENEGSLTREPDNVIRRDLQLRQLERVRTELSDVHARLDVVRNLVCPRNRADAATSAQDLHPDLARIMPAVIDLYTQQILDMLMTMSCLPLNQVDWAQASRIIRQAQTARQDAHHSDEDPESGSSSTGTATSNVAGANGTSTGDSSPPAVGHRPSLSSPHHSAPRTTSLARAAAAGSNTADSITINTNPQVRARFALIAERVSRLRAEFGNSMRFHSQALSLDYDSPNVPDGESSSHQAASASYEEAWRRLDHGGARGEDRRQAQLDLQRQFDQLLLQSPESPDPPRSSSIETYASQVYGRDDLRPSLSDNFPLSNQTLAHILEGQSGSPELEALRQRWSPPDYSHGHAVPDDDNSFELPEGDNQPGRETDDSSTQRQEIFREADLRISRELATILDESVSEPTAEESMDAGIGSAQTPLPDTSTANTN